MTLYKVHNLINDAKYTIIVETKNNTYENINIDYIDKNTDDFSFDLSRLNKYRNAKVFSISTNYATGLLQVLCKE